jgi:Putative zinc-finger
MNCRNFRNRIPEFLADALTQAEADELLRHAAECTGCSSELEATRAALAQMTPSHKLTASPRFKEKTMERIAHLSPTESRATTSAGWSSSSRRIWSYALGAAAVAVTAAVVVSMLATPTVGFAQVIERIAKARAFSLTSKTQVSEASATSIRLTFVEPGKMIMEMSGMTSVMDREAGKGLMLYPARKQFVEFDLSSLKQEPEKTAHADAVQWLRQLKEDAGEAVESRVENGRKLQGFRAVTEDVRFLIWADAGTGEILSVDYEMVKFNGMKGVMADFNFEPEVDPNLLSLEPPKDYTSMMPAGVKARMPDEEAMLILLKWYTASSEGNEFPPSANSAVMLRPKGAPIKPAPEMKSEDIFAQTYSVVLGMQFIQFLRPENDFHYVGKGVKLGAADKAVLWYKPKGSETYRVVYGDLTVRDLSGDQLPKE